jgi:hypothetical protein
VAYNFETGEKEIKLLKQYERVTQNVLLVAESMLLNAKLLRHARLSWT